MCTTSFATSPGGDSTELMIELELKLKYRELLSIPPVNGDTQCVLHKDW